VIFAKRDLSRSVTV